jgi:hypothetical protein
LQDSAPDRWRWLLDTVAGYSVKGTYQYITTSVNSIERGRFDAVWQRQVPLKVSVFTWRLLRQRLPTRDNLLRRGIIYQDGTFCIGGCGCAETAAHLILQCEVFGSVWHYVYRWVGISFIAPATIGDHFQQFGQLAGLSRSTHSFMTLIWHACVWVIWKERNNRIFQQKLLTSDRLAEMVKIMSFNWLKANMPSFAFSYNDWGQHPLLCMGVLV